MKPAIRVDNLSKSYRIGHCRSKRSCNLTETLAAGARGLWRSLASLASADGAGGPDTFWALKDVSFEVRPGEVIGIIGRNGAGKSTLLKILSRIVEPTSGRAQVRGRMGSLLEVGTGFHPELTGRENIYLNGSILGMSRQEIDRKFDEIVAFSEIEQFLDTPVKRYSSGMYVRLAFAVAAHLDPEILTIDEVLAVGDAGFQKKCLGKMNDVVKEGRTILFVSHNMGAIQGLCQRAILVEAGTIVADDQVHSVVEQYCQLVTEKGNVRTSPSSTYPLTIKKAILKDAHGNPTTTLAPGENLTVEIHYIAEQPLERPHFWIGISSQHGTFLGASMLLDGHCPERIEGEGRIACVFSSLPLVPQTFSVHVGVRDAGGMIFLAPSTEVGFFNVVGRLGDYGFAGDLADVLAWNCAPLVLPYQWHLPNGKVISVAGLSQKEN